MWSISISSTEFADEKLASLSVESPLNLRTTEGFGLLVGLWCGRLHDRIIVDGSPHEFTVGFQAGEVVVEPNGGFISNQGRLRAEGGQIKIEQSEIDEAKKKGSTGGQFGINVGKLLTGNILKADVGVGGNLDKSQSKTEQKSSAYLQPFWRIADAGHNFWRVYGDGLNAENILEHKIIGDDPLCHINAEKDSDSLEVLISFRCNLRGLWFRRDDKVPIPLDSRFDTQQVERNRNAVAARIVGLALKRATKGENDLRNEDDVVLARQSLQAVRGCQE